jgi:hypothetical protein
VPSRIEVDEPGIAGEFERAHGATRRQKADDRDDPKPEARKAGRIENREASDAIGYSKSTSMTA